LCIQKLKNVHNSAQLLQCLVPGHNDSKKAQENLYPEANTQFRPSIKHRESTLEPPSGSTP
jgi:hypothetical protein